MFIGVNDSLKFRPPDEDGSTSSSTATGSLKFRPPDEDGSTSASTATGSCTSSASTNRHKNGLDVMVIRFSSLDPTVGNSVARNCKEKKWKVITKSRADPIDIALHVHSHKLNAKAVSIQSDGEDLFCGSAPSRMVEMTEDICYEWTLSETNSRPMVSCIDELAAEETTLADLETHTQLARSPSTCTSGEVSRLSAYSMGDINKNCVVHSYSTSDEVLSDAGSAVKRRARRVTTKLGHRLSWGSQSDISALRLHVPKQDPSRSVLTIDGEAVSFGRPSPAPHEEEQKIRLKLSKDARVVTANVGHSMLSHFISGEVRAVTSQLGLLMRSWTVQLGPFATHTITVSKNYTFGKIITLVVDGEVFIESSAADLGFDGDGWQCEFSFTGERVLEFEDFDTDKADETSSKEERRKYVHKCCVAVPKDFNFGTARFFADGIDFDLLPESADSRPEFPLSSTTDTLQEQYGISVPGKEERAPNDMQRLGSSILSFFQSSSQPREVVEIVEI